jgi:EAL domain-containing protein (putative c-di-GMP-specific phosphodiesterase class I)
VEDGETRFLVSASIGISLFPQDGDDLEVLLRNADQAMYDFKCRRNGFQFFDKELGARCRTKMVLESRLAGALQRNEFVVHYQPNFRLNDLSISGAEALIRWNGPTVGALPPGDFIPIAETSGQIVEIGKWVLDKACAQASRWARIGNSDAAFRVAVNISASQFLDKELVRTVSEALDRTGANPSLLELEMTETVLVRDLEKSAATIRALRELGIRVTLDDFGTGYSSFNYLANLPLNALKIDRSLVFGIHGDHGRFSMLKAIVDVSHTLGIMVVAEGVEDLNQLKAVRDAGCDEVQGFLFAKPGLPEEIRCMRSLASAADRRISADLHALAARLAAPLVFDHTGKDPAIACLLPL